LPKWTSGSAIGNSQIFDNGTSVGINNASPSSIYVLDVNARDVSYNTRFYQPSSSTSAYNSIFISGAMTSANAYFGIGGSATGNTSFRDAVVIGSQSSHPLVFNTSDTERARITSAGRLLLGTTTDGGQRLQVQGTTLLNGQTTIRGTTNNDTTNILRIEQANQNGRFLVNAAGQVVIAGDGFQSSESFVSIERNAFNPTSGGASHTSLRVTPTINQTGGANGITRGLYVNPTLTAAADWRSIEWSNNSGWGLYGAGTANNYLGGRLSIATTNAPRRLNIEQANGSTAASIGLYSSGTLVSVIGIDTASTTDLQIATAQSIRFYASSTIGNIVTDPTNERMRLTTAGRLLLGTTTESTFLLDVNGTARVSGDLFGSSNFLNRTNSGGYYSGTSDNFGFWYTGSVGNISLANAQPIVFSTANTERLRITSGGNLLVGTTTDSGEKFQVNGTARFTSRVYSQLTINSSTISNSTSDASFLLVAPTTTNYFGGIIGWAEGNLAASISAYDDGTGGALGLVFNTGNNTTLSERLRITSTGNVGIGTSSLSTSAILQVDSTTKGFLPPRMTNAQRTAISSPAVGLIVYCTDAVEGLYVYKSTGWTFVI
jgi:uncharacterized protein YaiE (UPF0345 family)